MTGAHAVLRDRFERHITDVAKNKRFFDGLYRDLGLDGWIAAWTDQGSDRQGINLLALERSFEQIVNNLQGAFDLLERGAATAGLAPDPRPIERQASEASIKKWWADAAALGMPVADSDHTRAPGRWRRLALLEKIEHDVATILIAASRQRQLFAHDYAHRALAGAADLWSAMTDTIACLPAVVRGLEDLLSAIDPPVET